MERDGRRRVGALRLRRAVRDPRRPRPGLLSDGRTHARARRRVGRPDRSPLRSTSCSRTQRRGTRWSRPTRSPARRSSGSCIDGDRFVLKHVSTDDDWIARALGDLGPWTVLVWESGLLDLVPDCIDHTYAGAAHQGSRGAVLMRDVGPWLVPEGDHPISEADHLALPRPSRRAARARSGTGTTTSGSPRSPTASSCSARG